MPSSIQSTTPTEADETNSDVCLEAADNPVISKILFNIVTFFSLGICNLVPWFGLLNIIHNLRNQLNSEENLLKFLVPSISITSMLAVLFGNIINILVLYRLPKIYRVLVPLCGYFFAFIIIMISFLVVLQGIPFYVLIIFLAFITNLLIPIMISALYEDASIYGLYCFTAINTGQAFGGVIIALILIIIASFDLSPTISTTIFLIVILTIIIVCIILYTILITSNTYRESSQNINTTDHLGISFSTQVNRLLNVLKRHYVTALSIFINMTITLVIFPGLLLKIVPVTYTKMSNVLFSTILVQFCFNIGDFVGRYINLFLKWPKPSSYFLVLMAVLRLGFLPIFMLFDLGDSMIFNVILFKHDLFGFFGSFLFGLSGAHISTVVFTAPFTNSNIEDQQYLSKLLVLSLGLGLATGSALSFIFAA